MLRKLFILSLLITFDTSLIAQDENYGFVRTLEGASTIFTEDGESIPGEINQPVMSGDRFHLSGNSRMELVLANSSRLRLGERADLTLMELEDDYDATGRGNHLYLSRGAMQVDYSRSASEPMRIDSSEATIYLRPGGRLYLESNTWSTEASLREGLAEILTPGGTYSLKAGDKIVVDSRGAPRFYRAGGLNTLERWASRLEDHAYGDNQYLDEDFRYAGSSLNNHGSWVDVEGNRAWRPRVSSSWAPYQQGRWRNTRAGLTWISNESWGWVPYHYGSWDYVPGWGWVWMPGRRFAPAHVYWYWGPSYVGWCPSGYYQRYYRRRSHDMAHFRVGVHGWVGGGVDIYARWSFSRHSNLENRHLGTRIRTAHQIGRDSGSHQLERGILTSDTRAIATRREWKSPQRAIDTLQRTASSRQGTRLEDVTAFVERKPKLATPVTQRILDNGDASPASRRASSPRGRLNGGTSAAGNSGLRTPSKENRGSGRSTSQGNAAASNRSRRSSSTPSTSRGASGRRNSGQNPMDLSRSPSSSRGRATTPNGSRSSSTSPSAANRVITKNRTSSSRGRSTSQSRARSSSGSSNSRLQSTEGRNQRSSRSRTSSSGANTRSSEGRRTTSSGRSSTGRMSSSSGANNRSTERSRGTSAGRSSQGRTSTSSPSRSNRSQGARGSQSNSGSNRGTTRSRPSSSRSSSSSKASPQKRRSTSSQPKASRSTKASGRSKSSGSRSSKGTSKKQQSKSRNSSKKDKPKG